MAKRVLSWGFGVQSTALAVMSAVGEIPPYDLVIGADLGWEGSETYEVMRFYRSWLEKRGVPVVILGVGNIRQLGGAAHVHMPFFTSTGAPLRRQCTREFKIDPIKRYLREWLGYPASRPPHPPRGSVEQHLGISLDEYQRMNVSRVQYIVNKYPLCMELRMTRADCKRVYVRLGLPVPGKSACIGCPYRSAEEWLDMRERFPAEFEDAVKFDMENRNNPLVARLGVAAPELYVWSGLVPLADVDFAAAVIGDELPLFCESGFCHV